MIPHFPNVAAEENGIEHTQVHSAVRTAVEPVQREDLHLPLVVAGCRGSPVMPRLLYLAADPPTQL